MSANIFRRHSVIYDGIWNHLSIFYVVCAYFSFRGAPFWAGPMDAMTPPRLFFFVHYYSPFFLIASQWVVAVFLLAAAYFNRSKILSVLALLSFIHWGALQNIYGIADNGHRPAIWLAVMLLFLPFPSHSEKRIERSQFVVHYWFSLLVFSLCYALAGFWKVLWAGCYQLFFDHYGIWNPQALSYVISEYMIKTSMDLPSAQWFMDRPWVGWPLLLVAAFMEATVWIVFFRPSLWRLYAVVLLGMHIGTKLTLDIGFDTQFLLTGILFFTSPFSVQKPFLQTLGEVPGIKLIRRFL